MDKTTLKLDSLIKKKKKKSFMTNDNKLTCNVSYNLLVMMYAILYL